MQPFPGPSLEPVAWTHQDEDPPGGALGGASSARTYPLWQPWTYPVSYAIKKSGTGFHIHILVNDFSTAESSGTERHADLLILFLLQSLFSLVKNLTTEGRTKRHNRALGFMPHTHLPSVLSAPNCL